MGKLNSEREIAIFDKLKELIDEMEEHYGELEGFEVRLEHPVVDGQKQAFATIKEFNLLYLHRQQIEVK